MVESTQIEQLEQLKQRLAADRPVSWENLPDIPLYMDQVVSYLERQLITFHSSEQLTSAMINNYIKDGIVPRANGKRYERKHLTYLTAVAAFKQVLSLRDMSTLFSSGVMDGDLEERYASFCATLDSALKSALDDIEHSSEDLPNLAATLALRSYADALACRRILDLLRTDSEDGKKKKK